MVRALQDPVEQEHYVKKVAEYTDSSVETMKEKLAGVIEPDNKPLKRAAQQQAPQQADPSGYQDNLLAVAMIDPVVRDLLVDVLPDMMATDERKTLLAFLKQHKTAVVDVPASLQKIDTYVKIVLLKADARYGQWSNEDRYFETARLVRQLTTEHKHIQKQQLTDHLRQAEESGDDDKAKQIRHQLNELIKEIPRAQK